MENYLSVLEEALRKKVVILDKIQVYNEKQCDCFSMENVDIEGFDAAIEEKGKLIEELTKLDEGFEIIYANLSGALKQNMGKNGAQIKVLQELIQSVTEKSMTIQAQEARNKSLIEAYFSREKKQIKEGRVNSKVAYGYYKSLDKAALEANRGFDLKQ